MDYTNNPLRFSSGPPPLPPSRSSPASAFPGIFSFAPPFPLATSFVETPTSTLPSPPRSQEQQQQQQQQALPISQSRQIHRNRISYSCHACRRRKVKCDRQHPICGNCTRTSDVCIYDDHSNKKKGPRSGVQQPQGVTNPPRTKRQRTGEDSEDRELSEGYSAVATTANLNGPESTPPGQEKQEDLEARMNKLAEVVDKWYKDAYGQGIIPPAVARRQALSVAETSSSDTKSTFEGSLGQIPAAEHASSQEQGILDNMRKLTHSISGTSGANCSPGRSIACSSVSSPYSPRSQNTVTTPGSSVSGNSQQVPTLENTNGVTHPPEKMKRGELAMQLLSEEIEAARAKDTGDGIDDLGLGHLSIQGSGRSRYVGSSFWASITHEITELNEVLRTNESSGARPCVGPPAEEMIDLLQKPRNSTGSETGSKSSATKPLRPSSIAGAPNFCGLSQFDKSSLLQFEPRESGGNPSEIIPLILRDLPDKSVCDIMYKAFLNGVHPIMPLIHVPTFEKEYSAFWAWFPNNIRSIPDPTLSENHGFFPLFFSILYAGSMSLTAKAIEKILPGQTKMEVTKSLYSGSMHALSASSFPRTPTISSLIAFLIAQTCLIREEEPLTSCSFLGMAMRVAQSMGLHRDGSLFGLNEIECEVRRRVWWHIVYLDVQGAIATGLPPLGGSGEDLFDTKMVSELKDEYIGLPPQDRNKAAEAAAATAATTTARLQAPGKHNRKAFLDGYLNSPSMILAAGRYDMTIVLRKLITQLFSTKPPHKADLLDMGGGIFRLKLRLEDRIARIPARRIPEMGSTPCYDPEFHKLIGHDESSPDTEKAIVFNGWARIMLGMFADRTFGVFYQSFLKSSKSKLWDHARHCALHFCVSFLQKFVHVSKNPLFQPYQWFCPGTFQPLHSTMILLIDLHERPLSAEAPRNRGFVDEIFALFGEDGNSLLNATGGNRPLSEGGSLAWKMLARLRKKAYERAGIKIDKPAGGGEEDGMETPTAPPKARGIAGCDGHLNLDTLTIPATEYAGGGSPEPGTLPPLDIPTGGFEEMLFITDNVVTGTMLYKDTTEAAVKIWEKMAAAGIAVDGDTPMDPGMPTPPLEELPMDIPVGNVVEAGTDDVMEFDWEEWDAVFGRFTAIEGMVLSDIPVQQGPE